MIENFNSVERFDKKSPIVSIGMPVFNGESFIRDALDSLLAQSFSDFELIISDNASTDGTESICKEYVNKDSRVRYVKQVENRGPVTNFRFLLNEAVGEYFMWAAADDIWIPEYVERCIALLSEDERAAMATMAYVCNSRLCRVFSRRFNNPLECITIEKTTDRVKSFSRLHGATHKDNLVYSVWRKERLESVMSGLASLGLSHIIGGVMNEYALALFVGKYTSEVGFYKSYRYLPPGHKLDPVFGFLSRAKRLIFRQSSPKNCAFSADTHIQDLSTVLVDAGFSDTVIAEIFELNKYRLEV